VLCDIMPIDGYHIFLGRPWKYYRKFIYDGRRNTYSLEKDGNKHVLFPLKNETTKEEVVPSVLLMSGKELLQEVKKEEKVQFCLIGEPSVALTNSNLDYLLVEIQALLDEFVDIIVDELPNSFPPMRSISHHTDLIPRESIPNKVTYRITPKENEEIKNQV